MILVDTNVLVYSMNVASSKFRKAKEFLVLNEGKICVAQQNLIEAYRVLTSKQAGLSPLEVGLKLSRIVKIFRKIIFPTENTWKKTLEFARKRAIISSKIFDVYLYFTALDNGVKVIATENVKDFEGLKGLEVVNPFSA